MRSRCTFFVCATDTRKENRAMFDLICVAIITLFVAVAAVLARGCERLETEE
jgi:hypothetical protein